MSSTCILCVTLNTICLSNHVMESLKMSTNTLYWFWAEKNMTYFTSPWNSWFQLGCHIFFPCVCTWVILQTLQSTLLDNWTDSWTLMLSLNCMNLVLVLQTYQSTLLDIYVINLQLSSKFCWELLRLFWQWSQDHWIHSHHLYQK